jgi:hypothetical protein
MTGNFYFFSAPASFAESGSLGSFNFPPEAFAM